MERKAGVDPRNNIVQYDPAAVFEATVDNIGGWYLDDIEKTEQ